MDAFLPLIPVFILGAMSPGPSLGVVLRNSVTGGRRQGVLTAVGHGLGFGIYAFLAAIGLAAAVTSSDLAEDVLKWGGVALLLLLGFNYLRRSLQHVTTDEVEQHRVRIGRAGFTQGFLVAFLNPKILAWLLAIFAPVIDTDLAVPALLGIALMGMLIDMGWYSTVAVALTSGGRAERLRRASSQLDLGMAMLMFIFAALLGFELI